MHIIINCEKMFAWTIAIALIIYMDLPTGAYSECQYDGTAYVTQKGPSQRPSGQAHLTCYVQFPKEELLLFQWAIYGENAIYTYVPDRHPPGIIKPDGMDIINDIPRNSPHITASRGTSEIIINSTVNDRHVYECQTFLKNHSYCQASWSLQFEDPRMRILIDGYTVCENNGTCYYNPVYNSGQHRITAFVDDCQPDPILTLEVNGKDIGGAIRRSQSNEGYCQASIRHNVAFGTGNVINFTVIDNGRTYNLTYRDYSVDKQNFTDGYSAELHCRVEPSGINMIQWYKGVPPKATMIASYLGAVSQTRVAPDWEVRDVKLRRTDATLYFPNISITDQGRYVCVINEMTYLPVDIIVLSSGHSTTTSGDIEFTSTSSSGVPNWFVITVSVIAVVAVVLAFALGLKLARARRHITNRRDATNANGVQFSLVQNRD